MDKGNRFEKFWHNRPLLATGILAVALAVAEVVVDWETWIELNVSIVYSLPLVLAAAARSRWLLWGLLSGLLVVTFAVYALQIPPGHFAAGEPFFVNRVLTAATMLLTAGLGHIWMRAMGALDAQGRILAERNRALDTANRELTRRGELIARQNAELETRRREAEEASTRKTRLLASVSHDIRTPLNTINLLAEVLRRAAESPAGAAKVPDVAQRLQANARSLAELVADLVDVARLDSGRVDLKESEFSLNDLLVGRCQDLTPLAQAKGLRLDTDLPDRPIRLRADRGKLSRVLANLVGNAIKFTPAGGVTVGAAWLPGEDVLIDVRDTGVGIAPQEVDRIFDEFAQLQNAEGDRNKGWGLGLAICRRLVRAMGGDISVDSEPARGSTFTVHLPARCVADGPGDVPRPSAVPADPPVPGALMATGPCPDEIVSPA